MPDYRLPVLGLIRFVPYFLLARPTSVAGDGRRVMKANPYPRRIEDLDNVPPEAPFILVMNHYNRRGLRPQICAFIISAAVAEVRPGQPEVAWVFAEELEQFIYAPLPVPRWLMRWMFRRIALVYGILAMPREWRRPMERAAAMRRTVKTLQRRPIGLTPEGGGPGILREPPASTGLFLLSLAKAGYPFLPVAVYEEDDQLVIRFGETFHLALPAAASKEEADRRASEAVMTAIGRLLPERYQGAYRQRIA